MDRIRHVGQQSAIALGFAAMFAAAVYAAQLAADGIIYIGEIALR